MRQTGRGLASRLTIASSGIQAAITANSMTRLRKKAATQGKGLVSPPEGIAAGSGEEEDGREMLNMSGLSETDAAMYRRHLADITAAMSQVMWSATELDIRSTLSRVCTKITHDHSVSDSARRLRVRALLVLGEVCFGATYTYICACALTTF